MLLFFEQITPTPIPKRTIVPSLKCHVYASLLTSSLPWWEKASRALVLSHTLTNMEMAQSCESTWSLNESKKKKNNKNIKNPFTDRKEKKNVIILHCILKFAEITVLCRDDGSVN